LLNDRVRHHAGDARSVSRRGDIVNDAYTSKNYVARVQKAFASVVSDGGLQVRDTEFTAAHFGNFVVEFIGATVRLKVVRDRMQFLVDFAPPESDEWIDDETIWHLVGAEYFNEQRAKLDLRSLEQVAEATAAHFSEICALFTTSEAQESLRRANEYRQARAKTLFGYSAPCRATAANSRLHRAAAAILLIYFHVPRVAAAGEPQNVRRLEIGAS
jgi:hypothetical protein